MSKGSVHGSHPAFGSPTPLPFDQLTGPFDGQAGALAGIPSSFELRGDGAVARQPAARKEHGGCGFNGRWMVRKVEDHGVIPLHEGCSVADSLFDRSLEVVVNGCVVPTSAGPPEVFKRHFGMLRPRFDRHVDPV